MHVIHQRTAKAAKVLTPVKLGFNCTNKKNYSLKMDCKINAFITNSKKGKKFFKHSQYVGLFENLIYDN